MKSGLRTYTNYNILSGLILEGGQSSQKLGNSLNLSHLKFHHLIEERMGEGEWSQHDQISGI